MRWRSRKAAAKAGVDGPQLVLARIEQALENPVFVQ